ncbi:MAG: undecaprenyldiphospho-muramoylpentapeptide beta-N-acetylglucosaminyltransferase [Deltaproteobacteria bacterium]|jgi:UDP-N-acetylglucosamine--N-acetylmuramyl-(pentapeptide) pyrophosphoryl-undecaprenol N-acetylglucosamine transferase|nr:undecaprenyldiphospho-muramoylpentapeptide beta-N-acetylglucosaminyltransferase [Deltaproteobacteria bacterium]
MVLGKDESPGLKSQPGEKSPPSLKILVAAGGTGGHIMPAVSVCEAVKKIRPETGFLFVGTNRQAEKDILDPLGYERRTLDAPPLAGLSPFQAVKRLWRLFKSEIRAISLVREFKPDLCLTFGGYVCGPIGLAAKLMQVPLVIHEQNSSPGLTNKALALMADLTMVGFPEAEAAFKGRNVRFVGNPVREAIASLAGRERKALEEEPLILVLGGSQGSKKINEAVMIMAKELIERKVKFRLIHQTGQDMAEEVERRYADLGQNFEVRPFIRDMERVYSMADLAVTRAGALTLAELGAASLPAVLIPLPTSAGDHQTHNALSREAAGAAKTVLEKDCPGELVRAVESLLGSPETLRFMGEKAGKLAEGGEHVAADMARLALALLEEKGLRPPSENLETESSPGSDGSPRSDRSPRSDGSPRTDGSPGPDGAGGNRDAGEEEGVERS